MTTVKIGSLGDRQIASRINTPKREKSIFWDNRDVGSDIDTREVAYSGMRYQITTHIRKFSGAVWIKLKIIYFFA